MLTPKKLGDLTLGSGTLGGIKITEGFDDARVGWHEEPGKNLQINEADGED